MNARPLSDGVFLLLQKTDVSAQLMLPRSESPAGSSGRQTPWSGLHIHPVKQTGVFLINKKDQCSVFSWHRNG